MPDPVLGQAVKAFVVLKPGVEISARDIIRHCLAHLESFMAPSTWSSASSSRAPTPGKSVNAD